MDRWGELVALAEREHELALAGRFDEVADLSTERLRFARALGQAPASARPALERLQELQAQIDTTLQTARAFNQSELARVTRGRSAVRGYGAGLSPAPSQVDSLR